MDQDTGHHQTPSPLSPHLGFPASRAMRNTFLLLVRHPVYVFRDSWPNTLRQPLCMKSDTGTPLPHNLDYKAREGKAVFLGAWHCGCTRQVPGKRCLITKGLFLNIGNKTTYSCLKSSCITELRRNTSVRCCGFFTRKHHKPQEGNFPCISMTEQGARGQRSRMGTILTGWRGAASPLTPQKRTIGEAGNTPPGHN